ncbi:MAG: F0F1 ATP synthase subunit delta [Chloroflexi bacterium]|nr:F0F1 ATP synthase subunit delta [Chloroflexota bacterium]
MLELDWATLIFQVINFLILIALLYRFLFRPGLQAVEHRRRQVQEMIERAQKEHEEAEALRQELEARLAQVEEETEILLSKVRATASEEAQAILEAARQEAEEILAEARAEAQRERDHALGQYAEEIVNTVLYVSGRLLGPVTPPEVHDALVARLNEHVYQMGQHSEQIQMFRQTLGDRNLTAQVSTARPLTMEQQGQLARTLTALADQHVDLEITDDPTLIAGLRVRLGDTIIDTSLAGQLEQLKERVLSTLEERLTRVRS